MKVVVPKEVKDQMRAIARWWARHRSVKQASQWLQSIRHAVNDLADSHGQYPKAPESNRLGFEIRQRLFGLSGSRTHRILFRVGADSITILAVRHVAQSDVGLDDLPEE